MLGVCGAPCPCINTHGGCGRKPGRLNTSRARCYFTRSSGPRVGQSKVKGHSLHEELVPEEVDPEYRDGGNGDPYDSSLKGVPTYERPRSLEMCVGEPDIKRLSLHEELGLEEIDPRRSR